MDSGLERLTDRVLEGENIDIDGARLLYEAGLREPFVLMAQACRIRERYKGKSVSLCAIVNAKSGICPENCRFCAQSVHHETGAPVYPLIPAEEIVKKGKDSFAEGAGYFGIVTSGTRVNSTAEWNAIYNAIDGLNSVGIKPCGSLGMLDSETARLLKNAGLYRYHHNLETSRSFFDQVCSTHAYDEDVKTVVAAKEAGLTVCSGGIIGLGEEMEHRLEMAFLLRDLDVDSVPINILNPIPGTPLAATPSLSPVEILLTVALYRFILPDKDIKLCGGKERNLRQLLPLAMVAGCNSLMTGDYLTTSGRDTKQNLEMIRDLGLEPATR